MRIAIDLTPVQPGGVNGGARALAEGLAAGLAARSDVDCVVITAPWNHDLLAPLDGASVSRLQLGAAGASPLVRAARTAWRRVRRVAGAQPLRRAGADLLFCPFTATTFAEDGLPVVSAALDLQHRDLPENFDPEERATRDRFWAAAVATASHWICISQFTSSRIGDLLDVPADRRRVIYPAPHRRWAGLEQDDAVRHREQLGLDERPYWIYPANFWPHKSHDVLLQALARWGDAAPGLVCPGALDEGAAAVLAEAERLGVRERIHLPGYVSDDELEALWSGSEGLVYPSAYEGFGIPLVEAMEFGKPIVCSDAGSVPEVVGDAAEIAPAGDPDAFASAWQRVATDGAVRARLVEAGSARLSRFDPDDAVDAHLALFREVLAR